MTFPTPYTVQRIPWQSGGVDDHGNPIEGYGPPQDVGVYGWWSPQSDEHRPAGVTVDVKVAAPPSFEISHRDRIVIPVGPNQGTFDVVGEVEDYTHGPFGWQPGIAVNLQRVEG